MHIQIHLIQQQTIAFLGAGDQFESVLDFGQALPNQVVRNKARNEWASIVRGPCTGTGIKPLSVTR